MYFYYVEDNFDFEYVVTWEEIRRVLNEIARFNGFKDIEGCCEYNDFADEFEMAAWFRDDLKDYFYEEALEWYRENRNDSVCD